MNPQGLMNERALKNSPVVDKRPGPIVDIFILMGALDVRHVARLTCKKAHRRNHRASSYTYCSLTAMVCIAFGSNTYTIFR